MRKSGKILTPASYRTESKIEKLPRASALCPYEWENQLTVADSMIASSNQILLQTRNLDRNRKETVTIEMVAVVTLTINIRRCLDSGAILQSFSLSFPRAS